MILMKLFAYEAKSIITIQLFLTLCFSSIFHDSYAVKFENDDEKSIQHGIVYYEEGRNGSHPANHGIWSWDDEILVGFNSKYYLDRGGHAYDPSKPEHNLLARSLDGGETWEIEYPAEEKALLPWGPLGAIRPLPIAEYPPITNLQESIDFTHPDLAMTFRMESHRGKGQSHFYYSYDRGKNWNGPFALPLFGTAGIAARTDYLFDGENQLLVFLTAGKSQRGREGRTMVVQTRDWGLNWEFLSWIGPEPDPHGPDFRIMPSTVRISENEIITTVRKREPDRRLIKAWISKDNGKNWEYLSDVAPDVGGGSPSSLIKLKDGRLAVTYAHRAEPYGMRARLSEDNGRTWSDPIILRDDGGNWDIGYPRSVQRTDGKIVTIYYYWTEELGPERHIASTIWDPNEYNTD